MRTNLYAFLFAGALMLGTQTAQAQGPRQAILVNGNLFTAGNQATVASFDLNTGAYAVFDSVGAQFVSDIVIRDNIAFVAADSTILRYNIDTYQREADVVLKGVRKLAVWGDTLLATTGYGGFGDRVRAYSATDLQPLFGVAGISGDCEGIVIHADTAYVAVPGSFGSPNGKLALIDLSGPGFVTEIDLDSMGRGIDRMYVSGGKVWTVNHIAFANPWGVVTEYNPSTRNFVHHRVELTTMHSPGLFGGHLYLRRMDGVFEFDPSSGNVSDSMVVSGNFAAGVIDTVRQQFIMTESDFFSYGKLFRYDLQGSLIDSINVGISPEAVALDYRTSTGLQAPATKGEIAAWPVPAQSSLHLRLPARIADADVRVVAMDGKIVLQQSLRQALEFKLDISALPAGVYGVQVSGAGKSYQTRFVK